MEEWRAIPGYDGYEASTHGRIRKLNERVLKPDFQPHKTRSYPRVWVRPLGHRERKMVHALVARAFIGECPDGYEHNHKNGNKGDARPENLEFVTKSENERHKFHTLGYPTVKGSQHGRSKLTETDVIAIRTARQNGASLKEIRRQFGIGLPNASMIVNRKIWTHI